MLCEEKQVLGIIHVDSEYSRMFILQKMFNWDNKFVIMGQDFAEEVPLEFAMEEMLMTSQHLIK